MSMHSEPIRPVPEETVRVVRAALPKGTTYTRMRDELGAIFEDEDFAHLFSARGHPALAPWRLALVTVMQFAEGLSDRQAAEAVRARIDWKYTLGLELTDPGFDYSVLSEFRARLVEGGAEQLLLEKMLLRFKERGWLKARGRQRTDSTHVLASVRQLNRLELVGETMRATLNALSVVAPEWMRKHADPEWFERYGRRIEEYRLPKGKEARQEYLAMVGSDGVRLLERIHSPRAPQDLGRLPEVEILRRIWEQHYEVIEGRVRVHAPKEIPEAAHCIESPYEPEARYSAKRSMSWVGYKVHLTETCDDEELPRLITNVQTTAATATDVKQLSAIQGELSGNGLLPEQQLVDAAYVCGSNLVFSRTRHRIDLVGPTYEDRQWQAKVNEGFDVASFRIDWAKKMVTCPRGHRSVRWSETKTARGRSMIHVDFSPSDCTPCPSRSSCTRAKNLPRSLTLQPREEHEAIQSARKRQRTEEFASLYAHRAGIEGTVSQGVRAFGLRQARYRGLKKTHLQHLAIAAAINVGRIDDWLDGVPTAATRRSRFAALLGRADHGPSSN